MINSNTLVAPLERSVALFEDPNCEELPDELLEAVGPLFGEENFPLFAGYCDRIETNENKVLALADVVDFYMVNDGSFGFEPPELSDLSERIWESLNPLKAHLQQPDDASTKALGVVMELCNHGPLNGGERDCTLSISFPSRFGLVLWDRMDITLRHPVIAYQDLSLYADTAVYAYEPRVAPKPEPALYRYHPERFRAYHDFCDWLRRYFDLQIDKRSGLPTLDQMNQIGRHLLEEMNQKAIKEIPLRPRLAQTASSSQAMDAMISLAMKWGRYVQSGRQIFDFPPSMVDMFKETDVEDIPLNMIRMPYTCQYLYFGPQAELELEPGWFIDGAYVERFVEDGDFAVTVTACPTDHSLSRLWPGYPEPYFSQGFLERFRTTDLGTAVDEVLAEELAGHNKRINEVPDSKDITAEVAREAAAAGEMIPEGVQMVDKSGVNSRVRLDTTSRRFPIYRAALRLVVNALCYMTAYPDDVEASWPDGTPERLKAQTASGKFKEARNAKSKLEALGYVPVHFCGRAWTHAAAPSAGTGRKGVATHWRRGHWKRQPHGEGRKLRKLIWIMPTLVGREDPASSDPLGHVYLMS